MHTHSKKWMLHHDAKCFVCFFFCCEWDKVTILIEEGGVEGDSSNMSEQMSYPTNDTNVLQNPSVSCILYSYDHPSIFCTYLFK